MNASGIGGERRGGATFSRVANERLAYWEEAIPEANALPPMRLLASLIFSLQENIQEARRLKGGGAFSSGIASSFSAKRSLTPLENVAPPRHSPPIPEAFLPSLGWRDGSDSTLIKL